jgi:hypothetical protein
VADSLLNLHKLGVALLKGESPPDGSGELVPEDLWALGNGNLLADALASLLVDDGEVASNGLSDNLSWMFTVP